MVRWLGVVVLACWSLCASAGFVYRMEGGVCLDSTRPVRYEDGPGGERVRIVGDPLCGDRVSLVVSMPSDYVPGTPFEYRHAWGDGPYPAFHYTDAYFDVAITLGYTAWSRGNLPIEGPGAITWGHDALHLVVEADGTWQFSVECFICFDLPLCNPAPDGSCRPGNYMFARGTYEGWRRTLPEPASLALLLIVAPMALVASRRRRHVA
jgi:hypothetical protein